MDSPLRERLHRAIQDADTGMPSWKLRPAYAPLADAAISTLTLSDHIAMVEASGTHVVVPSLILEALMVIADGDGDAQTIAQQTLGECGLAARPGDAV